MRRIIYIVVFIVFVCSNAKAQGIEFMHDLDKALEKAKAENKIVFVDFYTSWCGPCKKMAKNVFTQEKVGDFFNKNFVCLKVDMEKGEGVELGSYYNVSAYPTLLFLDAEGESLQRGRGSLTAEDLIDKAKVAVKAHKQ